MDELEATVYLSIAGMGILGTVIGVYFTFRKDLDKEYDIKLREQRITAYSDAWKCFVPLAKFSTDTLTIEKLGDIRKELTMWYYGAGGLLIDKESMKLYLEFQQLITHFINESKDVTPETKTILFDFSSGFRTVMKENVNTRTSQIKIGDEEPNLERLKEIRDIYLKNTKPSK